MKFKVLNRNTLKNPCEDVESIFLELSEVTEPVGLILTPVTPSSFDELQSGFEKLKVLKFSRKFLHLIFLVEGYLLFHILSYSNTQNKQKCHDLQLG